MPQASTKVAVIGAGYWGVNHVRNFSQLGALHGIYDADQETATNIAKKFGSVKTYSSIEEICTDPLTQGVVISTPAATHFEIAEQVLRAGKDVLVEKPLAIKPDHGKQLIETAKESQRVLMVGHLLQYHPAVVKLKEVVASGELGDLEYIYSNRLNLGKIRTVENILWSFAPHDISIMLWLLGALPIQVNVVGGNYLQPNVADTTVSTFTFDNGVRGHIYVSWLHPFKEQRLVIVGSKRMAVFDDQATKEKKLLMYEKKVSKIDGSFVAEKPQGIPIPFDHSVEPLRAECEHFLHCMTTREQTRTDGAEGLRVLKVLQSCQRSLQMSGQPVQVTE